FPLAAAGIAVILLSAVAWFVTPTLQSPQTRLYQRIDEQIDRAQSMLAAYDPTGVRLAPLVTHTQPADLPTAEQWQTALQAANAGADPVAGQLQQLNARFVSLGGELEPAEQPGDAAEAYDKLKSNLERNQAYLAEALKVVQGAV